VLEAEDVGREQVRDGLAVLVRDPAAHERGIGQGARQLPADLRAIEVRDVLEGPVLLDERHERRHVRDRGGPDLGIHARSRRSGATM
jgi:hypothetical protein